MLVTPDKPITLAGKEYVLVGNLKALKDIQHAMDCEILQFVTERLSTLSFDKLARVIAIGITAGGAQTPALDTIETEIVEEIGIVAARSLIGQWVILATTPKKKREAIAAILEKSKALNPSHGMTTSDSPQVSLDGLQETSGTATSGTSNPQ